MKTAYIVLGLLFALFLSSCEDKLMPEPKQTSDPVQNFELLWQDFHDYYGLFEVKGIDWDAVYAQYRPQVHAQMTEAEFYRVITNMLAILNDAHVSLYPINPELPRWGIDVIDGLDGLSRQEDYDFEVVKNNYLQQHKSLGVFDWGWLPGNVGYIHVNNFMTKLAEVDEVMNKAAATFKDASGIIIDLRDNPGGLDPAGQQLAGYFASENYLYMRSRKRSGPNLSDFTGWTDWYVQPLGNGELRNKPIVVLTSPITGSGAETFLLAMKELPQVIVAGDTTAGAFSDNLNRQLYNGWIFSLSIGDYRDANGQSYEGAGLAPDLLWENRPEDVKAGTDEVLEKAIELLKE